MDKIYIANKKRTNTLVLGFFLLLWSMNGYFIGGNTLKWGLLILGFTLIVFVSGRLKIGLKSVGFIIKSFILVLIYWGIAYYQNQNTLDNTTLIFDIICLILVNSGFIIAKNKHVFKEINPKMVLLLGVLSIVGAYLFVKYQTLISFTEDVNASRVGLQSKADNVNAVGLAYLNAILFFFHFFFLTNYNFKKHIKIVLLAAMLSCVFVIFAAGARGAMLFIGIVLFINYFQKIKSFSGTITFGFKFVVIIILLVITAKVLMNVFPVLEGKIESSISRFQNLISFLGNQGGDGSASERLDTYYNFFENLNNFILFGMEGYNPYPHNQFLEVIMRWGILFGSLVLIFIIGNLKKAILILNNKHRNYTFETLFILIFLFSFLQSMTSMSLEMNRAMWLSAGFVAGLSSIKKNSNG